MVTRRTNLLLFTESFPFDAAMEATFIAPEVPHLASRFDRVAIIPALAVGNRVPLERGIDVPLGLATRFAAEVRAVPRVARALGSRLLGAELLGYPAALGSARATRRAIGAVVRSAIVSEWTREYMVDAGMTPETTVAYTYWWNAVTLGLRELKRAMPGLIVVSRAHGADLYHERHTPPWIPGQAASLATIDRVYPDSDRGTDYLRRRYPRFADKLATARLGVPKAGFRARTSPHGSFSIVSCSLLVPVKRPELIIGAIAAAAESQPATAFHWTHFGDGPLRELILQRVRNLPANVTAALPGYPGLESVMAFYREEPVDVFVNASSSEGTPVAAMEALSCGIPLLMTAVGGNTELAQGGAGVLVDSDCDDRQLGAALLSLLEAGKDRQAMRDRSVELWRDRYDADRNYERFSESLAALRESGSRR